MEKTLPFSLEAEQGVLGSILIDSEAISQIADFLQSADFYRDAHRTIYSEMLRLLERNMPADSITICDELELAGKLEDAGGISYIMELVNRVPTSGNIEHYARIVTRDAACRRLIHAAGQIAALGYERNENAVQLAEQILFSVEKRTASSGFLPLHDILLDYSKDLDKVHDRRGEIIGVPTGFTDLDGLLGGLQKTDLIILAARPGMGKSAAAMGVAYNAGKKGYKSAVFSLEMGRKQLAARLIAMDSGVDTQCLRNGWISNEQWQDVVDAEGRLGRLPIWINDTAGNPVTAMRSQLRRLSANTHIDLVIVDYLQFIGSETSEKKKFENRVNELADITKGLKTIAREFDVPVLALAQLSRAVEQRQVKIPQMSDLRESGSLENDADVVMFLYRDDYYNDQSDRKEQADLIIAKHRNGPIGTVTMLYKAERTRFYNLEEEHYGY